MQTDFNSNCFVENGAPGYLSSGEFHYFRVPHSDWSTRMRLFKEMGGNTIATYIPWLIHEPAEGVFDFDSPQINLRRFLDTAAAAELEVIARPGPYQYSELIYDGLPPWLCQKYPQLLARNRYGKVLHYSAASYLHPLFLEKTAKYFDIVAPILAEYSRERGGPIAMVQPDNELGGIHLWRGDFDCNAETMGFGNENGRFANYLRRRFGSVEAVNLRYQSAFGSLAELGAPPAPDGKSVAELLRQRDYADFYWDGIGEYLELLIAMLEARGVNGPYCHNSANPAMNACFREAKARLGDRLLLGSDHYYSLDQRWAQNNPTPQYALRCFLSLEQLRLMRNPPCVMEFPFGSLSDWPPITPEDIEACVMTHLAFGMRGHNGYVFTGGVNIPGTGSTTDFYDYNAPVDAYGAPRPTYHALKRCGDYINTHPELNNSLPDSDFAILMPWELCRADDRWSGAPLDGTVGAVKSWNDFTLGLLTSSFAAGLFPEMVNPDTDWSTATAKPLVLWNNGTLSAAIQSRTVKFLQNGGKLLCLPVIPQFDEDFQPCTILAEYLSAAHPQQTVSPGDAPTRINIAGILNIYANGDYHPAPSLPPTAERIGEEEHSGALISWRLTNFIYLGMSWCHGKNEHSLMLTKLLELLGMRRRVIASDSWVLTALRKHPKGHTLFAMNLGSSARTTTLQLRPDGSGDFSEPFNLQLPPMSVITKEIYS